jgi:hypothetical protein
MTVDVSVYDSVVRAPDFNDYLVWNEKVFKMDNQYQVHVSYDLGKSFSFFRNLPRVVCARNFYDKPELGFFRVKNLIFLFQFLILILFCFKKTIIFIKFIFF